MHLHSRTFALVSRASLMFLDDMRCFLALLRLGSRSYFGQLPAWLVGWNLLLEYAVGSSVESRAWSNYFVSLLHDVQVEVLRVCFCSVNEGCLRWWTRVWRTQVCFPSFQVPRSLYELGLYHTDMKLDFIAAIVIILIAIVVRGVVEAFVCVAALVNDTFKHCVRFAGTRKVMYGIKESSMVNSVLVLLKLAILLFFVILALSKFKVCLLSELCERRCCPLHAYPLSYLQAENLTPFFPHGPEGMFRGAAMVYFAFLGFDGVTSLAEETKDPEKNVPRGILGRFVKQYCVISGCRCRCGPRHASFDLLCAC